jgi:outer membrane protein
MRIKTVWNTSTWSGVLFLAMLAISSVAAAPANDKAEAPAAPAPNTPPAPGPRPTTPPPSAAPNPETAPPTDPALPPGPLTLEQAIDIAYRNHGDIAVAERSLSEARSRVTEARAGTRPNLTGGLTYQGRGVNDIGSVFGNVQQNTSFDPGIMPGIQLRNTLFDNGQTRLSVRSAQASVRGAEAGVANTRVNLAFDVTNNYFGLLRAQSLESLSREQVRQAEEQLQLVDARIEVGDEAKVSRFQVLVEVENARVALLQAQNQVRQSGAALRALMGLPVGSPPRLADVAPPAPGSALPAAPAIDEAVAEASRNHPQLLQDAASVDAARADLRLAGLRRRPILTTTTGLNLNPRDTRTKSDWTVLAGISMPIWDSGVTRARQEESRYRLESAEAREQQTRIDVTTAVQQAVLNIQNAKDRVDASAVAVEAATQNLQAVNARYLQGVVRVVDLTTAQVNNFQAQSNAITALYDYYIAQAQLKRAMGRQGG